MARGRMISKSLSTSERWARLFTVAPELAEFCQSMYPLLVAHADDFGRLQGDVHTVKHLILPASPRTPEHVSTALQHLHDTHLIVWYDHASRKLIQIMDFDDHQPGLSKRTKSKFPPPPVSVTEILEAPSQLNLTELNGTELKKNQNVQAAAAPPIFTGRQQENPEKNYRQILAIVHKEILPTGLKDEGDIIEATKARCAGLHITYNSQVVRKAVESALAQRRAS